MGEPQVKSNQYSAALPAPICSSSAAKVIFSSFPPGALKMYRFVFPRPFMFCFYLFILFSHLFGSSILGLFFFTRITKKKEVFFEASQAKDDPKIESSTTRVNESLFPNRYLGYGNWKRKFQAGKGGNKSNRRQKMILGMETGIERYKIIEMNTSVVALLCHLSVGNTRKYKIHNFDKI